VKVGYCRANRSSQVESNNAWLGKMYKIPAKATSVTVRVEYSDGSVIVQAKGLFWHFSAYSEVTRLISRKRRVFLPLIIKFYALIT